MFRIVSIIGIIFLSFSNNSLSQEKYKLKINNDINFEVSYESTHFDTLSIFNEITNYHIYLKANGFISSYIDTVFKNKNNYVCNFILSNQYIWKKLKFSSLLNQFYPNKISFNSNYINEKKIKGLINSVIINCQNNGYPFAQVFYDSITINKGEIVAKLDLKLNNFFVIDSVIVKGGMKTSLNYIEKQIGISKGDIYNEKKIKAINKRIRNIAFVETIRFPEIYFTPGKATLVLYLKDKSASRFDGILGLNPDEITGKIGVVGDLKVDLLNGFKKGENIILNWEQAKTQSQTYLFRFSYPFLFKTRIGIETGLNYYRQDTSFANLDADIGFSYFLDEKQKVVVSAQFIESNSLLSLQNNLVGLPFINSVSTIYYGVNYSFNSLDYRLNPRKGLAISAGLKSGNKKIIKNLDYQDNDYENLEEKTVQIKTDFNISCFIPVFKKSTLHLKIKSGNLFGDNIFLNELYQIGGLKTIRGFNQQAILASNYIVGTSEYRYLFEKNSAVFAYFDYAFYENKSTTDFETDTPFGFGLGTNFQTKAGIFSISYGLGKQLGNPILIKNGKVHFGFVSLF